MPSAIHDEFTALKLTPQRKYQLRHERDGLCRCCPEMALRDSEGASLGLCEKHAKIQKHTCARRAKLRFV